MSDVLLFGPPIALAAFMWGFARFMVGRIRNERERDRQQEAGE